MQLTPECNEKSVLPAHVAVPGYGLFIVCCKVSISISPSCRAALLWAGQPSGSAATAVDVAAAVPDRPVFTPRSNPRHLFLRTPLPSTAPASAAAPSAATPSSNGKQPQQQQPKQQQQQQQSRQQQGAVAGPSHQDKGKGVDRGQDEQRWKGKQREEEMQEEQEDDDELDLSDSQVLLPNPARGYSYVDVRN